MSNILKSTLALLAIGTMMAPVAKAADPLLQPGNAPQEFSVFAEGFGGFTNLGSNGAIGANEDDKYGLIGGNLGVMTSVGSVGLQLDIFGENNFENSGSDDTYEDAFGAALHLNTDVNQMYTVGVFGAVARVGIDSGNRDATSWILGAEGMARVDLGGNPSAVFLQGGFLDTSRDNNPIRNAGFIRGGVNTSLTEQVSVGGNVAYARGRMDGDNERVNVLAWGARVSFDAREILPVPATLFADYAGARFKQNGENDRITDNTFIFGISFGFGNYENDSKKRFDIPRFYRWVGQTGGPLE